MAVVALKKPLTTEDFKAQLYLGLVELSGKLMLPLSPIEWGQRYVSVHVTEYGNFAHVGIYDRAEGSEPLESGLINQGVLELRPGDRVDCTVTWPR